MTDNDKQIIINSYLGDAHWMEKKRTVTARFNGRNKEYLKFKRNFIDNLHHSKIWTSINRGIPLYTFTIYKNEFLTSLKGKSLFEVFKIIGDMDYLGFSLWIYDDGTLTKDKHNYVVSIKKRAVKNKKTAEKFIEYINKIFKLNGSMRFYKGYFRCEFKVKDTPIIVAILNQFSTKHEYKYKIPSSETIAKIASRYEDVSKRLTGLGLKI